jgi:ferredoxin
MASKNVAAVSKGCVACGVCVKACPLDAITVHKGKYAAIGEKCAGCGKCAGICPACVIAIVAREVEPVENEALV